MSEEIDACGTEDLICPYCGYINEDVDHNAHETVCCKCGEIFTYEIDYTWTYTSSKKLKFLNMKPCKWMAGDYGGNARRI